MSRRRRPPAPVLPRWLPALVLVLTACGPGAPLEALAPVQGDWIDPSLAPDWQPPAGGHGLVAVPAPAGEPAAAHGAIGEAAAPHDGTPSDVAAGDAASAEAGDAPDGTSDPGAGTDLADAAPPIPTPSFGDPVPIEADPAADEPGADDPALAAAEEAARPMPAGGTPLELDFEELALPEGTLAGVAADATAAVSLPDEITALDGRLVSLAGFLIPTVDGGSRLRRFALSYDPPGCCFGEAGSLDKWVVVELEDDAEAVEYRFWGVARVEGLLSVGARRGTYGHLESLFRLRGRRAELIE